MLPLTILHKLLLCTFIVLVQSASRMDNFYEPQIALITTSQVHLVALKIWHIIGGLYVWEFLTTLDYEWDVIRGRIPYRWTIWVYSLARVTALFGVILAIAIVNTTGQIDCQRSAFFSVFLFCTSATATSLLVVLRTIAIWNRNRPVLALAIIILAANIGFHFQSLIRLRSVWVPARHSCEAVKTDSSLIAFIPLLSDMILLVFVCAGLIAMRRRDGAMFGLTRLLWKQGVIWLLLGVAADIPPLVLTSVHLNDPLQNMFESPGVVIMTIAVTRMHRALVSFSPDTTLETPHGSSYALTRSKRTDAQSTVRDRVEVVVHKVIAQHSTGSMSGEDSFSTKAQCITHEQPESV